MADTQRYWDGQKWTENVAPHHPGANRTEPNRQPQVIVALLLAGSAIGLVMSLQSASLLTGTGSLWTGAAIAGGAGIASYVMRTSLSTWVRVVAIAAALIALANVLYVEKEMENRRQEIGNLLP